MPSAVPSLPSSLPVLYPYISTPLTVEPTAVTGNYQPSSVDDRTETTGAKLAARLGRLLNRSNPPSETTREHAIEDCVNVIRGIKQISSIDPYFPLLCNKIEYWCRDTALAAFHIPETHRASSTNRAIEALKRSGNNLFLVTCGLLNLKIASESAVPGLLGKANYMKAWVVRYLVEKSVVILKKHYLSWIANHPEIENAPNAFFGAKPIDFDKCRGLHLIQAYDRKSNPQNYLPGENVLEGGTGIKFAQQVLEKDYSRHEVVKNLTDTCLIDLRNLVASASETKPEDFLRQHYSIESDNDSAYAPNGLWKQFLNDETHAKNILAKAITDSLNRIGWH